MEGLLKGWCVVVFHFAQAWIVVVVVAVSENKLKFEK